MSKENIKKYTMIKIINVIYIVLIVIAIVSNIITLYISNHNMEHWQITLNISVISFMATCILLLINRTIKTEIVKNFMKNYLSEQKGEIVKEKFEEYLIKIDEKLYNVNVRFTKQGVFVLKQRAATAAEIEAYLFNGKQDKIKTSKYNNIWQTVNVDQEGKIQIK